MKTQERLILLVRAISKRRTIFKQVYVAAGLLILSSVLLFSVVSMIQEKGMLYKKQNEMALQPENYLPSIADVAGSLKSVAVSSEDMATKETAKMPLKGNVILAFGWQQHPVYKDWRYHTGMDIGIAGKQDIQAVFSGKVIDIYTDKHSGLTVAVESKDYKIFYGSLSAAAVTKGSFIKAGDCIGKTGSCREEPAEHLHLAVKKDEHYINPASLF